MFSEYEDDRLTDMVFETNFSAHEMGLELGKPASEIQKEIKNLGLGWVRRRKGHISRGQAALTQMMSELLPGEDIQTEAPLGDRLRLDVYCPKYELAAEYHGRQHFFYTQHFHGDKEGFEASQARDERKIEICKDLGIALVVFRYNDDMSRDSVYNRMLDAIQNTPMVKEQKDSRYKGNAYYEKAKARQKEYRRAQYLKMKKMNGRN